MYVVDCRIQLCFFCLQENRIYAIANVGLKVPDVSNGLNRGESDCNQNTNVLNH